MAEINSRRRAVSRVESARVALMLAVCKDDDEDDESSVDTVLGPRNETDAKLSGVHWRGSNTVGQTMGPLSPLVWNAGCFLIGMGGGSSFKRLRFAGTPANDKGDDDDDDDGTLHGIMEISPPSLPLLLSSLLSSTDGVEKGNEGKEVSTGAMSRPGGPNGGRCSEAKKSSITTDSSKMGRNGSLAVVASSISFASAVR